MPAPTAGAEINSISSGLKEETVSGGVRFDNLYSPASGRQIRQNIKFKAKEKSVT